MVEDLKTRKPSDSIQNLTECLCDVKKVPLLQDPALEKVDLCYKALPHYETFARKREGKVTQRLEEGEAAAKAEKRAKAEAAEAKERAKAKSGSLFSISPPNVNMKILLKQQIAYHFLVLCDRFLLSNFDGHISSFFLLCLSMYHCLPVSKEKSLQ